MISKNLFLFFILFCSTTYAESESDFSEARRKVTHQVLRKFKKIMEAKGFDPVGIGEGIDHRNGKQNYLKLVFDVDILPEIDFARRIEVKTLQEFLHCINSQEGIQDYLAEYPFPLKFIHIGFISKHPEEGLFSVSNFCEELYYDKRNPDNPLGPLIEVYKETYEEAIKIITQKES